MPSFQFLAEPLFWIAAIAAGAAAIVRGLSGFGAGLIFMPVAAACLGPKVAAGALFIIDTILVVPFAVRASRLVEWREIVPLASGAVIAVPLGVWVLISVDPVPLRWGLSLAILVSVGVLAAGWRYHGPSRTWLSLLVGGLSGFMSGSVQTPGPPVLIYWLGRQAVSATMRANAFTFFLMTTALAGAAYFASGIMTTEVLAHSAALFPFYAAGIFFGSRMFGLASEATYRRIAYAVILFSAIVSMPVFV